MRSTVPSDWPMHFYQSVAKHPVLLHLHIKFPLLCLSVCGTEELCSFYEWTFSFFMNERLSLTSSVSLRRSMQMNVWMDQRRDWQMAPKAFSPSLSHKLASNHRRVGWLMLHTHSYTHTLIFWSRASTVHKCSLPLFQHQLHLTDAVEVCYVYIISLAFPTKNASSWFQKISWQIVEKAHTD